MMTEEVESNAPKEPPRLMSLPLSADYLGISRSTMYRWVDEGKFPIRARNIAGRRLFSRAELDKWLAEQGRK